MTGHGPSSRRSGPVQLYQGRQVGAGCRQRHAASDGWHRRRCRKSPSRSTRPNPLSFSRAMAGPAIMRPVPCRNSPRWRQPGRSCPVAAGHTLPHPDRPHAAAQIRTGWCPARNLRIRQRRRRPHLAPYAAAGCASSAPGEGGRAPAGGGPQVLENLFGPGGVQPPFCHTFDQRGLRATRASPSRTWRSACFRASSIRLICPLMRWRAECSRQGQPRHLVPRCRPVCVELRRLSALPYGRRPPARRPSHASLLRRLRT